MECKESEEKCFTFLWKLENISFCLQKRGEEIKSPTFVMDAIGKTKWKLSLYPRGERDGNYIGYFLNRETDTEGADTEGIKYELALSPTEAARGTGKPGNCPWRQSWNVKERKKWFD
ncbi:hypothetical protein AVEN_209650-1 [Araneus ventricosus]|uniref:MATH domain-containing protein n=1 Tax=Araneus ventricosus TaxID=182803 RepID=A0A4Y2D5J7_ARAVE|nr:hypothetical protein AVEN_209650-1 [Araneus ventricosus]